jgi:hypothetical protein
VPTVMMSSTDPNSGQPTSERQLRTQIRRPRQQT